jgi:hypothetical protein
VGLRIERIEGLIDQGCAASSSTRSAATRCSMSGGNQLTVNDERRKLELVVGTASKIWG